MSECTEIGRMAAVIELLRCTRELDKFDDALEYLYMRLASGKTVRVDRPHLDVPNKYRPNLDIALSLGQQRMTLQRTGSQWILSEMGKAFVHRGMYPASGSKETIAHAASVSNSKEK